MAIAYPTRVDLGEWLQDAGFSASALANLDLTTAAAAGVATFEQATGRRFLATTQTREYDPCRVSPRGVLDLKADLAALTSVAYGSTSYVVGTDVRAAPLNAPDDGRPYAWLEFGHWRRFYAATFPLATLITVVGSWGYGTTIPDDAWQAMLAAGGLHLFPYLAQEFSRGALTYKEQDVTEEYGPDPMGAFRTNWMTQLYGPPGPGGAQGRGGVVGLYRRVTMS